MLREINLEVKQIASEIRANNSMGFDTVQKSVRKFKLLCACHIQSLLVR
jgi:hypothetical protein